MSALEARVARLEAIEEIRRLKARYAAICDNGFPPDPIAELFTSDAVFDGGPRFGRYAGRAAIREFFGGRSAQVVWTLHYMIAPDITVADDLTSASARWYLWQPGTITGSECPRAVWISGRYEDEYRLVDGVWLFHRVTVDVQTIAPFEESWVTRPFLGEPRQEC